MQSVGSNLNTKLSSEQRDLYAVVEFYTADAVPDSTDGFDPTSGDFLFGYASVSNVTFLGVSYERRVTRFRDVQKTINKQSNTFQFTLSNLDGEIADYEITSGFEGLVCVLRILSRSQSNSLSNSLVVFIGRSEKPQDFSRQNNDVDITVKHILASTDQVIPRRKFQQEDPNGRPASDYLYEGFRYRVQYATVSFNTRERRSGFLGLLGFKKTVTHTVTASSVSDLDVGKPVPICYGKTQIEATHAGYIDLGNIISATSIFCDTVNTRLDRFLYVRSANPAFPINPGAYIERVGLLGGPYPPSSGTVYQSADHPGWVANDTYSRSAYTRESFDGTLLQDVDPAPGLVGTLMGIRVAQPSNSYDASWLNWQWSDNPVWFYRWLLTTECFYNLNAAWIDDATNEATAADCDEIIEDRANSDYLYLPAELEAVKGTEIRPFHSSGLITPEFFKWQNGEYTGDSYTTPFEGESSKVTSFAPATEKPQDFAPVDSEAVSFDAQYRRRYTCNLAITEEQKLTDFLYDVLLVSMRGYVSQNAKGQLGIKIKKPTPYTHLTSAASSGGTTANVWDVTQFAIGNKLLLAPNNSRAEVKTISDIDYTTAGNSITLAVSSQMTRSGATFSGGSSSAQASATVTVDSANDGELYEVTIDGIIVALYAESSDTTATIAGAYAAAINAHPQLSKYIVASWTPGAHEITLTAKLGVLTFSTTLASTHPSPLTSPTTAPTCTPASGGALKAGNYLVCYSYLTDTGETLVSNTQLVTVTENQKITVSAITLPPGATAVRFYCSVDAGSIRRRLIKQNNGASFDISEPPRLNDALEPQFNSTGEELIRIDAVYADKRDTPTGLTNSNIIENSLRFPISGRQSNINQVRIKFRSAVDDYALTELRLNDKTHQDKVHKILSRDVNGSAIDNFNQAYRIGAGLRAEHRDADFFVQFDIKGLGLLHEEGDIICVSDSQGHLVAMPLRVEDVSVRFVEGDINARIIGRRYYTSLYDDRVSEKEVSLVTGYTSTTDYELYPSAILDESGLPLLDEDGNWLLIE